MGDGARICFHAASRNAGGLRIVSATGNALVGPYLSQLGLRFDAINYVTKSGPAFMTWLTIADAQRLGFEVTRLSGSPPGKQTTHPLLRPATVNSRYVRAPPPMLLSMI